MSRSRSPADKRADTKQDDDFKSDQDVVVDDNNERRFYYVADAMSPHIRAAQRPTSGAAKSNTRPVGLLFTGSSKQQQQQLAYQFSWSRTEQSVCCYSVRLQPELRKSSNSGSKIPLVRPQPRFASPAAAAAGSSGFRNSKSLQQTPLPAYSFARRSGSRARNAVRCRSQRDALTGRGVPVMPAQMCFFFSTLKPWRSCLRAVTISKIPCAGQVYIRRQRLRESVDIFLVILVFVLGGCGVIGSQANKATLWCTPYRRCCTNGRTLIVGASASNTLCIWDLASPTPRLKAELARAAPRPAMRWPCRLDANCASACCSDGKHRRLDLQKPVVACAAWTCANPPPAACAARTSARSVFQPGLTARPGDWLSGRMESSSVEVLHVNKAGEISACTCTIPRAVLEIRRLRQVVRVHRQRTACDERLCGLPYGASIF
uniref:WD_REPEATS_REGION domain-containing protein n=1 Tax=Macrostomum lignano TaxID=282301 RepID=A0A1I8JN33_9PLAT